MQFKHKRLKITLTLKRLIQVFGKKTKQQQQQQQQQQQKTGTCFVSITVVLGQPAGYFLFSSVEIPSIDKTTAATKTQKLKAHNSQKDTLK